MRSTPHDDELRRSPRVRICCRADARQLHAVWNAVTVDLSARGCRLATAQHPRPGARVPLRLSSDLIPEELDAVGVVVWVGGGEVGLQFLDTARREGSLAPSGWLAQLLEHGRAAAGVQARPGHLVPAVIAARRRDTPIPLVARRSG